jgi:hypothetical protein
MAEPARPFWEQDELIAKAPPRSSGGNGKARPFWEADELVATKAEVKKNPGILEAIGRGGLQGATLQGGDELYAAGAGAVAKAQGRDFGPEYERQLAEAQAANRAAKEAHPWAYGISEAAGLVPGLLVGGSTNLGARALGLVGKNLAQRSLASAVSGAAIGAVQGGAGAEDGERGMGAVYGAGGGALVGAVSPAIGEAVGKGVGAIASRIRSRVTPRPDGMSNSAAESLSQDLRASGGANAVRSRLDELGPDARLLDASPSFQGRAQGLAIQPETREMITAPLTARNQGTNARLATDLDSAIGPAPIPSRVEAQIAQGRELIGKEYENLFVTQARAVDTSDLAGRLDVLAVNKRGPAAQAIAKVRGYLDIPGNKGVLDPHPAALFETRQAIDGLLEAETNSKARLALGDVRQAVDRLLADAVPGIKQVDAKWQELARQSEGLQRGAKIFDGGKTAIRPGELADDIGAGALPKGEMVGPSAVPVRMRQGARAEIDRLVGTEANDLNALRKAIKGEGDWNYTKLVQTFGSKEGAKVWNAVDREAAFREAYQNIVGGSQTALRTGAAEGTKVRGQGGSTASAGLPAVAGAIGGPGAAAAAVGAQGARMGANQVMKAADLARNRQMAGALTMRPGPELDSMIESLAARLMVQDKSGMTGNQARALAQSLIMSQGDNAAEGIQAGARWAGR